jgi:hypothetical protein
MDIGGHDTYAFGLACSDWRVQTGGGQSQKARALPLRGGRTPAHSRMGITRSFWSPIVRVSFTDE